MKSLQLKKYDIKELKSEISDEVIFMLTEALNNLENLTNEDIDEIINYQDNDGAFRPYVGEWRYDGDAKYYVDNKTSILCVSILIGVSLLKKYEVEHRIMNKALNYLYSIFGLGHGYYGLEDELKGVQFLLDHGLNDFLKANKYAYHNHVNYLYNVITVYKKKVERNETYVGFGENIKDLFINVIKTYEGK